MKLLLTFRHYQPEHRRRARRPVGQADRGLECPRRPDRDLSLPHGPGGAWRAISGHTERPFSGLGWKSLGVLELTALPSIKEECWVPNLRETDALLVWGGRVMYLCYWMRQSGLADLLPSLSNTVYVGVSAGSIVMTPHNPTWSSTLSGFPREATWRGKATEGWGWSISR